MDGWLDGIPKQHFENHGTIEAFAPFLGLKIPQNCNIFKEKYQERNKHPLTAHKMVSGMWLGDMVILPCKNMENHRTIET